MALSNTELRDDDSNVLRLPADKRKEYHAQVDRLIAELGRTMRDQTEIKITKVVKAGSFAKYTILRKTAEDPVDVDVVFYISGRDINHETLSSLSDTIHKLLLKIYPNKDVEDFEIQRKAATVSFVGSGLSVDIVPVIEDEASPGYGWQYDSMTVRDPNLRALADRVCSRPQVAGQGFPYAGAHGQEVAQPRRAQAAQVLRHRADDGPILGEEGRRRHDRAAVPPLPALHRPVRP